MSALLKPGLPEDFRAEMARLHRAGFPLLPLGGGEDGKKPLLRGWADKSLTLAQMFGPMHRAGVPMYGIRLDGLAVVDCDIDDPGLVAELEARFGPSPVHVQTPRGLHFYYLANGKPPNLRGEGLPVDIKTGPRAYVAGPHSMRPDGGIYAPVRGVLGVDALPRLKTPKSAPVASVSPQAPILTGTRHVELVRGAVQRLAHVANLEELTADLRQLRDDWCETPKTMPETELAEIARWACPKCEGAASRDWMQARIEDLLPVEYFHVVFTLPAQVADIAHQNKAAVYGLLFNASAQTLLTIAADPKHLGARIGMTSVLHTWGSAMTHHPHVHVIVPGGGLSPDGTRWVACRPGFFLPVQVLSRLFRRLFLEGLWTLHRAGKLAFFGNLSKLTDPDTFQAHLAPLRKTEWVVYSKPPFGGPAAVLAYLSRYTHRVAISNHRLVSADAETVAFRWKDYRIKRGDRMKVMRLPTEEFIRRFLVHVLPSRFHRIRHAGFLANGIRRDRIEKIRCLIDREREPDKTTGEDGRADADTRDPRQTCPECGGAMIVIETFTRGQTPKSRAPPWEDAA